MNNIELDFLKSAVAFDSEVFSNAKVLEWIDQRRADVYAKIEQVPLNELKKWKMDSDSACITHVSGGFFSIEGVSVRTDWGNLPGWDQPIINQPEIGYLGFLAKKINGVLHVLVQAKIEPGNVNVVQISPTLQATKSNYRQLHKGKRPRYLEYFNGERAVVLLLDQLQSEQGARFLKKRNRNMIVLVPPDEEVEVTSDYAWMTIGQVKRLMSEDNVVNMDSRTVLSGITFGSYSVQVLESLFALDDCERDKKYMLSSALTNDLGFHDFKEILSWITRLKSIYELVVEKKDVARLEGWSCADGVISRNDGKYFSVIGVRVSIDNREVVSWDQPMVKPAQEGLIAFIVRPVDGVFHFLVQAKLEAGNFDIIELAPTVQCLTGNYRTGYNEYSVPYINDVLNTKPENILYSSMQSEEGGRFYHEQNRNMIVKVDEDFPLEVEENYCWMTLNQILRFIEFNNYLNIGARNLISSITFE